MKKKTFARIGAVVLSVMLLIVLMPATAFATDKPPTNGTERRIPLGLPERKPNTTSILPRHWRACLNWRRRITRFRALR